MLYWFPTQNMVFIGKYMTISSNNDPSCRYAIKSGCHLRSKSSMVGWYFSWVDATEINAEALAECLSHDYKLFDETPAPGEAQNAYALYHIISSNDKRARDKETIYQLGGQMAVWQWAGMPTTPNMMRTGPCPTQDSRCI